MIRFAFALLAVAFLAVPSFAQDAPVDRLTAMEQNLNAVMANVARVKSDVADMSNRLANIEQKLDALAKNQPAKQTWQPATSAWGTNSVGRFISAEEAIAAPTASFGASDASAGACANGSCSAGSSRGVGLFRPIFPRRGSGR